MRTVSHRLRFPFLFAGAVAVAGCWPPGPAFPDGTNPVGGYQLEVSVAGSAFSNVAVESDGTGCGVLSQVNDAYRTCLVATNLIPTLIGGEAYGELNDRHTPAYDALVWRARANGDPSVCQQGGLEANFLANCRREATDLSYEYRAAGLKVRVPIGGALPTPPPPS